MQRARKRPGPKDPAGLLRAPLGPAWSGEVVSGQARGSAERDLGAVAQGNGAGTGGRARDGGLLAAGEADELELVVLGTRGGAGTEVVDEHRGRHAGAAVGEAEDIVAEAAVDHDVAAEGRGRARLAGIDGVVAGAAADRRVAAQPGREDVAGGRARARQGLIAGAGHEEAGRAGAAGEQDVVVAAAEQGGS